MNNSRHLYIIGNGFDMYHGANSSYAYFREYLLHHNVDVVKSLEFFFGPRSLRNTVERYSEFRWYTQNFKHLRIKAPETKWARMFLWKDFERYLSSLNREKLFDMLEWSLPKTKHQVQYFNFQKYQKTVESIMNKIHLCTFELKYQFHKWIKTLHYAKGYKTKALDIESSALFLNFNYTTFLEDVYGVPHANIMYIHGSKNDKFGSLVLGHSQDYHKGLEEWMHKNRNRKRYRTNLKDNNGNYFGNDKLSYLAYFAKSLDDSNWITEPRYYAILDVKNRIEAYFRENFKDTTGIICNNGDYFSSLHDIEEIIVLGHSLGEVDHNYFKAIVDANKEPHRIKWTFCWYSEDDKKMIAKFKEQFSLNNVNLCTWDSFNRLYSRMK